MVKYIEDLRREGPSDFPPKKPTSKLPIPFNNLSRPMDRELHEYLMEKISTNYYNEPEYLEKNF